MESIKFRGAIATEWSATGQQRKVFSQCNAALFALHCKNCFELNFALNILHCTATVESNRSVQLKQILDFSLGCKAQCNRDHCWHWTETDDGQPLQFWHYYETYLSCFDYKNIYWIVRVTFLSSWIIPNQSTRKGS